MPAWLRTYLPTISSGLDRLGPLQQVINAVTGRVGALAGVLRSGASWLWSGFQSVTGMLWNGGRLLLFTLLGMVVGIAAAFRLVVSEVQQFARAVAAIRNSTGLSMGQSLGTTFRFAALGMNPQQTAQMLSSPEMMPWQFNMRAGMLGLPGYEDPNFAPRLAQWYQGMAGRGQMGRYMANLMMDNVLFAGQAPPEMRAIANMPQNKLREQMSFTSQAMNIAGINPEVLRRYAEDIPLVTARIGVLATMLRVRLATEALPIVERLAIAGANLLGKNMGSIIGFIQSAVEWLWVYAPIYILQGAQMGVNAITFLVGGFFLLVRGIANLLRALEMGQGGLAQFIEGFLTAIDYISVGWRGFATLLLHGGALLTNVGIAILNIGIMIVRMVGWVFEALPRLFESAFPKLQGVWSAIFGDPSVRLSAKMTQIPFVPLIQYDDTQRVIDTIAPVTDLRGQWNNFQNSGQMGRWADQLDGFADKYESGVMGALGNLSALIDKKLKEAGTPEERRREWQELLKATKDVEKAVRENGQQGVAGISPRSVLAEILRYIAEDGYLVNSRVS